MQPPPPYEMMGGPPRKKNSALPWLIVGGVLVCCIGPIGLIGGGAYFGMKNVSPIIGCTVAMSGISRSLSQYAAAHGGKLPPAATWQTDIAPYYDKALTGKDTGPFTVPSSSEPFGCGDDGSRTAFVYNAAYAGQVAGDIKNPDKAIIVFESSETPSLNKSGTYKDQGKAASPKIFGTPRGWFAVNAEFESVSIEDGAQKPMAGGSRRLGGSN